MERCISLFEIRPSQCIIHRLFNTNLETATFLAGVECSTILPTQSAPKSCHGI